MFLRIFIDTWPSLKTIKYNRFRHGDEVIIKRARF